MEQESRNATPSDKERWLRAIFEHQLEGVLLMDDRGRFVEVNPAACTLLGYRREELLETDILEFVPINADEKFEVWWRNFLSTGVEKGEYELKKPNGTRIVVEFRAVANILPDHHLFVVRDVSERKEAEEALRRSEARYRAILQGIPDLIIRVSKEGIYRDIEARGDGPLVAPQEHLMGRNIKEVLPEDVAFRLQKAINKAVDTGQTQRLEYVLNTLNGFEHEFEARITRIDSDNVLFVVRDITEQRRLEREILRISTSEQQRIGQDLHDLLGSHLTGVAMMAQGLVRDRQMNRDVDVASLQELARLINEGVEQIRALSRGLNPIKLDEQGLTAALQELTVDAAKISGLEFIFEHEADFTAVKREVAAQLYWIAQEAVTNVLRHAQDARKVQVKLKKHRSAIELSVQDDGAGITAKEKENGGMGFHIMHHRARMIGAVLTIDQVPEGGTRVRCTIPVQRLQKQRPIQS